MMTTTQSALTSNVVGPSAIKPNNSITPLHVRMLRTEEASFPREIRKEEHEMHATHSDSHNRQAAIVVDTVWKVSKYWWVVVCG